MLQAAVGIALALAIVAIVCTFLIAPYTQNQSSSASWSSTHYVPQLYAFTVPGTYSFVVPGSSGKSGSWVKGSAKLVGAGGGGAGAFYDGTHAQAGGGGGGGAELESQIWAAAGATLTVVVGSGGLAGTGIGTLATGLNAGTSGSASILSGLVEPFATLTAGGGFGAGGLRTSDYTVPPLPATGGVPIPGAFSAETGGYSYAPFDGQNGGIPGVEDGDGGAGGAAPNAGAGGYGGRYQSSGVVLNANGGPGLAPGGGGGGGSINNTTAARLGGAGAAGAVYLWF
jgi:hypothetical protein